jgi:hypothetical protein
MTFSVMTNIATMILCIAVLVQAVRLMRALDSVKNGALTDVVTSLDTATNEARRVLGKLTELLRGDVADTSRTLAEGRAMIEELAVMTGIANAIAERILDAAGASSRTLTPPAGSKAMPAPDTRRVNPPGPVSAPGEDPASARPARRARGAATPAVQA